MATPMPPARPHGGGGQGHDARLGQGRCGDLSAGSTEGSQQGVLAGALGDDDREGVVDGESGDQEGHAREHQQEDGEDRQELTGDHVGVLLGRLLTRDGLNALGQQGSQPVDELLLADAGARAHQDARRPARLCREALLGVGAGHAGVRHLGHAVLAAEGRQADDLHLDGVGGAQRRGVADLQISPVGGAAVDDDLAGPLRGAALGQPVRVEFRIVDPIAA